MKTDIFDSWYDNPSSSASALQTTTDREELQIAFYAGAVHANSALLAAAKAALDLLSDMTDGEVNTTVDAWFKSIIAARGQLRAAIAPAEGKK